MAKATTKSSKNKVYSEYRFRLGTLIIILGAVLSFALGVGATIGLHSMSNKDKLIVRSVEITGSDGLMGLVGYSNPFKESNTAAYFVTYNNTSSEDRFIQIKATQRSNDGTAKDDGMTIDLGEYTGTTYSEKKLVKAGTKESFVFPITQYLLTPTKYVEFEAFKTQED